MTPVIPFDPPPQNWKWADGGIHVFCASLDPPPARLVQLLNGLSAAERARASRFIFARDGNRFAAGRGMLREILGWLVGAEPAGLNFSCNPHGKPRLAAPVAGSVLHFNLAHSDSLVVYAVSQESEVGIDIEHIRPMHETEEIAAQFFSERECARWHSFPAAQKAEAFFNCWTRKEAWLKACGEGIGGRLDQTEVFFDGDWFDGAQNSVRSLSIAVNYAAAVAAMGRAVPVKCWKWQRAIER